MGNTYNTTIHVADNNISSITQNVNNNLNIKTINMSTIGQTIEKDLIWLKGKITQEVKVIKINVVPVVITIVEGIKKAEDNGILPAIATVLGSVTDNLSITINNDIEAYIPKALAFLLGVEGLPENPTTDQVKAFETAILTAIGGLNFVAKTQLWSTLGAQLYTLINDAINGLAAGTSLTFAKIVALVDDGYTDYKQDVLALNTSVIDEAIPANEVVEEGKANAEAAQ